MLQPRVQAEAISPVTGPPTTGRADAWLHRLIALALTGLVYVPILSNYFHADDFYYLYVLNDGRPIEFLFTPHGGHMLVVRNAVFALCHALFGTDPLGYFAVVLATHFVNVLLLFALIRALTGNLRLACFGAALWGMCPVNEGSLGWYSVYGHVLAATLVLWVLLEVVRAPGAPARWWKPWLWYAALLLASMSFGVGMAVAMAFPVVIALLLPPRFRVARRVAWSLPLVIVALYRLVLWLHTRAATTADPTAFGLVDMAIDLWWIIPPTAVHLLNGGIAYLLLWPFNIDVAYPSRLAYATAVLFYAGALTAAVGGSPTRRRQLAACAVIAAAAYGMIAIGRGPILPSLALSPDSAAKWHRYQYLGTLPLAVVACLILEWLARRLELRARWADACFGAWLGFCAAAYVHSGHTIDHHDGDRADTAAFRAAIYRRVNTHHDDDGPVYITNMPFGAIGFMGMHWTAFPGWVAMFIAYFPDDVVSGKRIVFVEPDLATIEAVRHERAGTRTARLLAKEEERGAPIADR
jgi:hypothetical protein